MKKTCVCVADYVCTKHYGASLDLWLDKVYPEVKGLKQAEEIINGKNKNKI
jgi:hypothetical protein